MQSKENPEIVPLKLIDEPFSKDSPGGILAHRLYMARCRVRWTQEELVETANRYKTVYLTQQRVSEIERGVSRPAFLEVCAIAKAMGYQLAEFDV